MTPTKPATPSKRIEKEQHQPLPAEHRGMPAREVQPQREQVGQQVTQKDASAEASLRLPHERDQSEAMTSDEPSPIVEQASADVARGLKDTSKQPEMLDAYQKQKQGKND
jgi:hypothetical protein